MSLLLWKGIEGVMATTSTSREHPESALLSCGPSSNDDRSQAQCVSCQTKILHGQPGVKHQPVPFLCCNLASVITRSPFFSAQDNDQGASVMMNGRVARRQVVASSDLILDL